MNWLNDLNNAMDLIEERLPDEVSLEELARAAGCSAFHLQRMFPYLTGLTLADYLRRRRLSLAAMELADGRRVTDVAFECGYDSPTAFTRAFKALHGVAPSKVAQGEAQVKAYPRLVFTLSVKGDEAMEYTIKTIPAFRVVGALAGDDWTMENAGQKATEFWAKLGASGLYPQILACMDGSEPEGLLGVSFCDDGKFKGYMVGVATSAPCPENLVERVVPEATYAVFPCVGALPEAMQTLQQRIVQEWLPSSGYEWAARADVEVYLDEDMSSPSCRSEVWLPIVKRA